MAVSRALKAWPSPVTLQEAANAAEAEAACRSTRFDVVTLDVRLPDRDGLSVLRTLRACGHDAVILMLTGFGDEEMAVELMRAGASDYLAKSRLTPERLEQRLTRALRVRAAELAVRRNEHQRGVLANASLATHANLTEEGLRQLLVDHACALIGARTAATTLLPAKLVTAAHSSSPQLLRPPPAASLDKTAIDALQRLTGPLRMTLAELAESPGHAALLAAAALPWPEREWLCVPMRDGQGNLLGVLQAADPLAEFRDGDLAMLDQLAHLGSLALQNARLFRELREASLAREELMAIVSHDLRNPISVVAMSAAVLLKSLPDDEQFKQPRTQVGRILRASQQMTRLVGDLLDASRIEEGKLAVELAPLPAGELLDEAIEAFQPLAQEKGVQLTSSAHGASPIVTADRARILQVFSNLLGNAFKFTPRGGSVNVSLDVQGQKALLSVQDTGQGIAAEHLPRLFDRFWQPRANSQGAGLGLFIAKGIVEAHGGVLSVSSSPGAGSTFSFTVPLAKGEAGRAAG